MTWWPRHIESAHRSGDDSHTKPSLLNFNVRPRYTVEQVSDEVHSLIRDIDADPIGSKTAQRRDERVALHSILLPHTSDTRKSFLPLISHGIIFAAMRTIIATSRQLPV